MAKKHQPSARIAGPPVPPHVVARAVRAFGNVAKAQRWLEREVPSLGGRKPTDLLRTEVGTREVLAALDRIQFGGAT